LLLSRPSGAAGALAIDARLPEYNRKLISLIMGVTGGESESEDLAPSAAGRTK
jgi:hypothetical protein